MEVQLLATIAERRARIGHPYLEFQRSAGLSAGLYVLQAGEIDRQQPHTEDEIYYVVAGRGRIAVGDDDAEVHSGSVIFVPSGVPHRFHGIAEELQILVVFGPAEGAAAGDDRGTTWA
jgi:mannose-6-phosphate isomerase-like protein (cupin superfamily)